MNSMALDCENVTPRSLNSYRSPAGSNVSTAPALVSRTMGATDAGAAVPSWISDLLMLTKARANVAVVATAVVGYALHADVGASALLLLHLIAGTALLAGSASMANQAIEHAFDLNMTRTRNRPIASGRLDRGAGFLLSALFFAAGCLCLATGVNLHAMIYGLLAFLIYIGVYTPMKRVSSACTLAGAVSGALPLLIGWAAAGAKLGLWVVVTFSLLYLWQIPHFMAVAWWRRAEYLGAGYRVLPANDASGLKTASVALASCIGVMGISLIPVFTAHIRSGYAVGAIVLGTVFTVFSVRFCAIRSGRNARALFLASLFYLPAIFALMLLRHVRE